MAIDMEMIGARRDVPYEYTSKLFCGANLDNDNVDLLTWFDFVNGFNTLMCS